MIATICLLLASSVGTNSAAQDSQTPPAPNQAPPAPNPVPPAPAKPAETSKFSYTYGQFDILRGDGDGYDDGPDGFDLRGSYALTQPGLFVFGAFSHLNGDVGPSSPDTDTLGIGLGYHMPIDSLTDLVVGASLMHAHAQTPAPDGASDGYGYGLDIGARHMANDKLEVNGGLSFTDFEDSDSEATLHAGVVYAATPALGLVGEVSTSSDLDALTLGIRYTP